MHGITSIPFRRIYCTTFATKKQGDYGTANFEGFIQQSRFVAKII